MAKSLADFVEAALHEITEIEPEDVRALLERPDRGGYEILDVRELDEWQAGRLPGARHYPRGFLEVRADLDHYKRDPWLEDRARKLILYCGGGHRSALAVQTLQQMGFEHVRSMRGGWTGWTERGLPTEG
jgi:rhodanese-related sulfurtransferase